MTRQIPPEIATDLVEYLLLVIPGPDALTAVGPELVRLVDAAAIRVLDLVVVTVDDDGEGNGDAEEPAHRRAHWVQSDRPWSTPSHAA